LKVPLESQKHHRLFFMNQALDLRAVVGCKTIGKSDPSHKKKKFMGFGLVVD